MSGCLMGVYLTGVYLMGMYLTGVHLTGVHVMGVHLTDFMAMHLIGVYLMGHMSYRRVPYPLAGARNAVRAFRHLNLGRDFPASHA